MDDKTYSIDDIIKLMTAKNETPLSDADATIIAQKVHKEMSKDLKTNISCITDMQKFDKSIDKKVKTPLILSILALALSVQGQGVDAAKTLIEVGVKALTGL